MKIGFVGQGWIGKNYANDFEERGYDVVRFALEEPYVKNKKAIKTCDITFVAVPTPTTKDGFNYDILRNVLKLIGNGKVAVIKSTVLPEVTDMLQEEYPLIYLLHSPEFLTEATASFDSKNPDRNIVGIPDKFKDDEKHRERAQAVMKVLPYAPYSLICSAKEAAFIKYGGNNWFYFKVLFINMLYDLVKASGEDISWETIRDGMAADHRIGRTHLDPIHKSGRGAGGHCFIKDFEAFRNLYDDIVGEPMGEQILAMLANKNMKYLKDSNKDIDLLEGVYGKDIINE